MNERKHWEDDFPVEWHRDEYVTRREFTKFLGCTSLGLFVANALIALREHVRRRQPGMTRTIARVAELPVGKAKLFHYPTSSDPCLLIRLSDEEFVAYSQKCTHLSCPVVFHREESKLHCPCHEGWFSAKDGAVLSGPPERPLPRVALRVERGVVVAAGMRSS